MARSNWCPPAGSTIAVTAMLERPPPSLATTFCFSNDRGVRLVKGLCCPHCGRELTATDDIVTDLFGSVVIECSACDLQILAVS